LSGLAATFSIVATPGITTIKSFTYRDAVEEWGNSYHFVGDPPSDDAGWDAIVSALITMEKAVLPITTSIVRAYCYPDLSPHHPSVLTVTDATFGSTSGSLSTPSGSFLAPGDAAMWIRWKTARTNTHGKPIYLRKYYHGVIVTPAGGDGDSVESTQHTALLTLGTALNTAAGDWPGIAGPDGVAPGARAVSPYATTRTLRRRGRRP
jgi:hypothetical protein